MNSKKKRPHLVFKFSALLLTLILFVTALPVPGNSLLGEAQAQLITRRFPDASELGTFSVVNFPEVVLNKKSARLNQGSLIRNQDNRIVLSGTLSGQYVVVYVMDPFGEISLVWILRDDEIAREQERMKQKRIAEREAARPPQ